MSSKADREAAQRVVATYHEAQLRGLLLHVSDAVDGLRRGELDPFEVDQVVFQYSRAVRKLWVFCNDSHVESLARIIAETPAIDWWERGAFRKR